MKTIYKTADQHLTERPTLEEGCWVHLQNPTKEKIVGLTDRFKLDPTFLSAALDVEEKARLEHKNGQTLIVVDMPFLDKEGSGYIYSTLPIGIVIIDDAIITVATQKTPIITDFIEDRILDFSTDNRSRFVLQLLYRNASMFHSCLSQIDKASMTVRHKLEKSLRNQELLDMIKLDTSLILFSNSLKGNQLVLEKMMRLESVKQLPEGKDMLEDVLTENRQAVEMCTIYRDILSGTMDAYASIINNNLSIVMKVLASLTVLLSIPVLFASFWGMNVAVPFSGSPFGFFIVLAMSVITASIAFILLWRKKMF